MNKLLNYSSLLDLCWKEIKKKICYKHLNCSNVLFVVVPPSQSSTRKFESDSIHFYWSLSVYTIALKTFSTLCTRTIFESGWFTSGSASCSVQSTQWRLWCFDLHWSFFFVNFVNQSKNQTFTDCRTTATKMKITTEIKANRLNLAMMLTWCIKLTEFFTSSD